MPRPRKIRLVRRSPNGRFTTPHWRDASGRFARKPHNAASVEARVLGRRIVKVARPISRRKKRVAAPIKFHPPTFNLCYAADRQDFYDTIVADRRKLLKKLSPEDASALRVEVDIIGKPPKKKTKSGRLSKRKTTAFIGKRTFSNLHRLRRFLLLESGYGKGTSIDWTKQGFCQYPKTAAQVLAPTRPGKKWRKLKKYEIES